MKKTTRQIQQESPGAKFLFHYRCNDGEGFEAVAVTESGAFCVLNAERPGIYGEVVWSRPAKPPDFRIF